MCVCVCVDDMVRNARRTHEKRKWTANVERASDRRRTQTNKREIIAKSIENQSKIHRKSTPNRRKIDAKSLLGPLGAIWGDWGRSWDAPRTLRERSRTLSGRPGALLRGCWLAQGRSRDVQEHSQGAFGCVFREVWVQAQYFDDFCSFFR